MICDTVLDAIGHTKLDFACLNILSRGESGKKKYKPSKKKFLHNGFD